MDIDYLDYKGYAITIVTSFQEVYKIITSWNNLLKINNSQNIYLDPNYFTTQFNSRSPGYEPFLVFFSKGNEDSGCIIAKTKKKTFPVKIGYIKIETAELKVLEIEIDGVLSNKNVTDEQIISEYLQDLISNKKFDAIEFQHLSERNFLWDTLNNQRLGKKLIIQNGIELFARLRDKEKNEPLIYHKSKTLRNFKRIDRILNENLKNVSIKKYNSVESIDEFINKCEQISKKSYHFNLGIGIEKNKYWINLLTSLANEAFFNGYILYGNGIPIAYNYGVIHQNIFFGFNMSFNLEFRKLSPGNFLIRKIIENLLENSIDIYHFGYGESEYKRLFSNESNKEASFIVFGNNLKSSFSYAILNISTFVNTKLIYLLNNLGLQKKIKKMWRNKISD